jgi:hypothetical protein
MFGIMVFTNVWQRLKVFVKVGFGPSFSFAPRAFTSTPTRVSLGLEAQE